MIGVGSDFRMFPFVTPSPVYTGDPILLTALVSEAGLPITGCTVTVDAILPGGSTMSFKLFDDGAHSDGAANDGEYAKSFTQTFSPGIYHFTFRTVGMNRDGQQVVREAVRDKPVLERGRADPGHPGNGGPGHGRPGDGGPPPPRDCCDKLLKEISEQNKLLKRLLGNPPK